jgi:hypothetical protein
VKIIVDVVRLKLIVWWRNEAPCWSSTSNLTVMPHSDVLAMNCNSKWQINHTQFRGSDDDGIYFLSSSTKWDLTIGEGSMTFYSGPSTNGFDAVAGSSGNSGRPSNLRPWPQLEEQILETGPTKWNPPVVDDDIVGIMGRHLERRGNLMHGGSQR